MSAELERWTETGVRAGYLSDDELEVIRAAQQLVPAFANERPVPCHRDYGPANWLVSDSGAWAGVIDFELAYWDVRVADFSRYPDWEWMRRPGLVEALLDGYGRPLTREEKQQCLVARTRYALSAIVWGSGHSFHGFAEEGRQAIRHLSDLLR
jgi:Ser/Thr protein kinase RdoA (MazF antagonist)